MAAVHVGQRLPYAVGLDWQRSLARARIEGRLTDDLLLLLEHEPVVTVGRGGEEVPIPPLMTEVDGPAIPRFEIERGGDATYHGPGQLVGYPILDLAGYRKDLHWYMRRLEEALILALGSLGLRAGRVPGFTGVWAGRFANLPSGREAEAIESGQVRKIASIGVHVSRWVTWHGFALNVTDEALQPFSRIVPCGIAGVHMTSLEREGAPTEPERVLGAVERGFAEAFEARVERVALDRLAEQGLGIASWEAPIGPSAETVG